MSGEKRKGRRTLIISINGYDHADTLAQDSVRLVSVYLNPEHKDFYKITFILIGGTNICRSGDNLLDMLFSYHMVLLFELRSSGLVLDDFTCEPSHWSRD